ncbi:uncharacterized protein BT62DRAFT_1000769 [Guyanagaster necrorhizus]|uniref:Transmembrane protein n=1 Tax=Guyanagaster necrorhizus TaxID=856835 RepID=A0A9P8AX92_9AGAR|nr:uncharacterized protein BT62DRAFT_1000769 [Guyanagaster necrorhizus MCA 3950]KAG7451519.1 hypothetical protein BT62DRAFT_1000769 [Guyanagaster necrorhizus MCA 3950]
MLLLVSSALSVNFSQCLVDIQSGKYGINGLLDNQGNPVSTYGNATAATLKLCYHACGRGSEPFSFPAFAQESSAWFVPWLALLSQLPFGANDLFENASYIILAVGSPTLIIYSLSLSAINTRWIGRLFDNAKRYPNRNYTARAFNALQHCCFYLEPSDDVLASVIVLPQNDAWWEGLVQELESRRLGWTISAFFNLIWVLISFILTIIDALNTPNQDTNASGQSIGLLWLWLYPVVVGWIVLSPECDRRWLESQLLHAGSKAVIASETPGQFYKCPPNKHPITLCRPGTSRWKFPNDDIYRTLPIFDYARAYWLNQVVLDYFQSYHSIAEKAHARGLVQVNGTIEDKHRTGSKDVIVSRCYHETPLEYQGDSVCFRVLKASIAALVVQWGTTASGIVVIYFTPTKGLGCRSLSFLLYGLVSTVAWWCMIVSAWLAHRSSTWPGPRPAMEITTDESSHLPLTAISMPMLAPSGEPPSTDRSSRTTLSSESCRSTKNTRASVDTAPPDDGLAVFSRFFSYAGKTLAFLNALLLFGLCLAQLGNGFSNCWCNSSYIGLRSKAYTAFLIPSSDFASLRAAWGGAIFLGTVISSLFAVLIIFAKKTCYPD